MGGGKSVKRSFHTPVMVKEVLEGLNVKPGGVYLDATVGGGGHAEAILKASSPGGRLIGIDCDSEAILEASKRLKHFGARVFLSKSNFSRLSQVLDSQNIKSVDGIVVDLGVSSHHLNTPERGFSFRKKGPLDMRMDLESVVKAEELVNTATEIELSNWFSKYGEERFSKRIARHICRERKKRKIEDTLQLARLVCEAVPMSARRQGIHPATRVFQALRIVVNGELRNLEMFLGVAPMYLNEHGRLVVLSYHSLEDRMVKERFQMLQESGFSIITKKPLTPSKGEVNRNPSSKSAKLRILERL